MKLLRLVFLLGLILILNSCQEKQQDNTEAEGIADIDEPVEETENDPTTSQTASEVISEESLVTFYNKVLERLYPTRGLSAQYENQSIAVSGDAMEHVEGGGMSRKYLRVVDQYDLEIGAIIYETSASPYPITLSIAVLEKGNVMAPHTLVDVNGNTILRMRSIKNGDPDKGPYDYNYYAYDESINLQPIFSKRSVDIEPNLSNEDKEHISENLSSSDNGLSQNEIVTLFNGGFVSLDFDEGPYEHIFDELQGIEKYYVFYDLLRLHSLLKYNNDERYLVLENDLKRKNEHPAFNIITQLDTKSGYIKYHSSQTDCEMQMTYWKKKNGNILIGHAKKCCTMFCDGDITFILFNEDDQGSTSVTTKEIIREIDDLKLLRPDNYIEGDGYDSEFILPQEGKNIRYCVGETCTNLIWQDGTFSIEK